MPPPNPVTLAVIFIIGGAVAVATYGAYRLAERIGREALPSWPIGGER